MTGRVVVILHFVSSTSSSRLPEEDMLASLFFHKHEDSNNVEITRVYALDTVIVVVYTE